MPPRTMNPGEFQRIDRLIHEKGRLAIMALLASAPELSFTEIRDTLAMTDGNLSVHLRNLQEAGYISVSKAFVERKPRTTCQLTEAGRAAFTAYIDAMERIVRGVREERTP